MENNINFPEPDAVLKEKPSLSKYIKYIAFFGPGAIVASGTIGQGQLILGPQMGAWGGFRLLWLITLAIGSYIIAYIAARFTLLSGIDMMDIFAVKKGYLNWLFIIIVLVFVPLFAAAIVTTLGRSLEWIFGYGNYLVWGISFSLLAALLVIIGKYKIVEYTQAFFVAILAIGAVISVIVIKPDILQIFPHFFMIGDAPQKYPQWVAENFPTVTQKPIPLIMLGYLGTLTVSLVMLVGYSGWIKVKRWGIFKNQENPDSYSQRLFNAFKKEGEINYLPRSKNEIKKAHLLLKPMLIDISIAFVIVAIVSAAYMLAGTYLLGARHLLPSDINLLREQAIIFSNISPWLEPLYQISVFFAIFGTVYAGFEAAARMLYETSKGVIQAVGKMPYKKFMTYLVIYLLSTGIPLAISGASIILILSITLLFIGVVGVIIYGIGAIYISQKVLPREYRLGKCGVAAGAIAIIFLIIPMIFLI